MREIVQIQITALQFHKWSVFWFVFTLEIKLFCSIIWNLKNNFFFPKWKCFSFVFVDFKSFMVMKENTRDLKRIFLI